jgi:phospholipase C
MNDRVKNRRQFLRMGAQGIGALLAASSVPLSIQRALAIPAARVTGTIKDVEHIVILMQENRSFDHYFGTLRGVRGFGDRHPVPLASGKPVWYESNGEQEIPPYHLDTKTTSAHRVPSTPHTFADAQAAWSQGQFGLWPKFKTPFSMGYYNRDDIPFQFALAEAFTICDAYHCSITTGTDPNRIIFWSGSNANPMLRTRGINCTDSDAEVNNLRCWIKGALPEPGYIYAGSAFQWPTIPDALERAGVSWRIYQDPNDNWTGLMHGGLAFASFRDAQAGSGLYEKGMTHRSLEQFSQDVKDGSLPRVSWILPPMLWSQHPAPSSPLQGAEFTSRVLDALTSSPEAWSKTVLFLAFDENDGLFDHVPPPAPPSFNLDGTCAGKATLDLRGEYFSDPERKHLLESDQVSGSVRPWGLGSRVPMYVISPWSRGGWVNSQVFDHTSVGQFLEGRFGITIPAISPWHRAVCGDLTSVFNFVNPNEEPFPKLPAVSNSAAVIAAIARLPVPAPPETPQPLYQEAGVRPSRALPYELQVDARVIPAQTGIQAHITFTFRNTGRAGAVFHVYDRLHLDRIPRRYTVESGKQLTDEWILDADQGRYDLWVLGPSGFVREFRGTSSRDAHADVVVELEYDIASHSVRVIAANHGSQTVALTIRANAYRTDGPWPLRIARGKRVIREWNLLASHHWYDFTITSSQFEQRFAGRMETGLPSVSDPAV